MAGRRAAARGGARIRAPRPGAPTDRPSGRRPRLAESSRSSTSGDTSRRRWPARSRPTRISPRSRSVRAGSPRAWRIATAVSVTVRATSASENRPRSNRSGGANRPRPGIMSGSPGPPGHDRQGDVGPGPRADRDGGAGRHELDDPAGLLARLGQPGRDQPIARADAAQDRGQEPLGPARLEDQDRPRVPGQDRRGGLVGTPDLGRLPAPWDARGRAQECLDRNERGRLATEDPGRRPRTRTKGAPGSGRIGGWPRTSRIRGRSGARPSDSASAARARNVDGVPRRRTTLPVPSARAWKSSPKRACIGPSGAPSRRWTKPRTSRNASSKASHGLRSRHWPPPGSLTRPWLIRRVEIRPG